ncbi:hypothetical protein C772_00801 [Bhargavaea cecembensis DSE10]|uniref:Uncharacterized protein n=1 Tax=Bhargavaea cecembensis DSE10 TaxID=1235279 RepID=M7NJ28_9BACL|nr:hypothetical protein [Bhargavaea cecembensis]EMR07156.1 hypothetical protein C772_00801 [Bhargavaea cecembensis DSE10]
MADKSVRLHPVASVSEEMDGFTPVSIAIGADGELCLLFTKKIPALAEEIFPRSVTRNPIAYRAVIIRNGAKTVTDFPREKWNYHFFETIDDGNHLLLCGSRSCNHGDGNIERNARVYTADGQLVRQFCLGDGIDHLSVTPDNHIWCGYFDEGIFGNYGWEDPLGKSGLVKWSPDGRIVWEYQGTGNRFIADCYAMTTVGNEAAFHYYTDFDVGFVQDGQTVYYSTDIDGASAMAATADGSRILFYEDNQFIFTERKGRRYVRRGCLRFKKPNGKKLSPLLVATRGPQLLMLDGPDLYLYDMGGA